MKFFIKYFLISFLIFTVVFTPAVFLYDRYIGDNVGESSEEKKEDEELHAGLFVPASSPIFDMYAGQKRVNILLVGIAQELTDTIMIASYDMETKYVDLISVPRDTYYYREGYHGGSLKINAVYRTQGLDAMGKAISETLHGMPINYYALIDYEGVADIVDSMGGVPMDVKGPRGKGLHYKDPFDEPPLVINIPEGYQILDGEHAVQYLRYRHGYIEGDLGRIKAQQAFAKAALKQAIGLRLPVVAATVIQNVETNISLGDAAKMAASALGMTTEGLNTVQMPAKPDTINGLSFVVPDDDKIDKMINDIYEVRGSGITPSAITAGAVQNQ